MSTPRITNTMMNNTYLYNMWNNIERTNKYQIQLATGRRITRLSDDPTGVIKSMQARVKLYRLEQHQDNVATAQNWLKQAESCMNELNSIIVKAYESIIQVTSDYYNSYQSRPADDPADPDVETPANKHATAELIKQLRDQILDLANAQYNDRYMFGGYNTTQTPFTTKPNPTDPTKTDIFYNGIAITDATGLDLERDDIIQFEIGLNLRTNATFTGIEFLGEGEENVYKIFDDLYSILASDTVTSADLSPYITKLQEAQNRTLEKISEVGGRTSRLDMVANRYADDFVRYSDTMSMVEDTEMAESIMNWKMAEAVYTASLQVGAKILQQSLLDYLR